MKPLIILFGIVGIILGITTMLFALGRRKDEVDPEAAFWVGLRVLLAGASAIPGMFT